MLEGFFMDLALFFFKLKASDHLGFMLQK